jgi:hypothetical protein
LFSCSIFNLVAIAIDRYLAVIRPLTYKLSSKWMIKIGIPAIWLISALLSIQAALTPNVVHYGDERKLKCDFERSSLEVYLSVCCLVVSFIVLIVLYSIICYRLWRRNIPGEVSNNQHALAIRTARKVTVSMISVVIVFVVSWAPALVVILADFFDAESAIYILIYKKYPFLFAVSYWLILNSSASNPCLYFIFIESFRKSLKTACSRCHAPKLRLCRVGQERQFETEESMRTRQSLNIFSREDGAVELVAYSTVNHRVAPRF